jgi:cellobiose phosphorylase
MPSAAELAVRVLDGQIFHRAGRECGVAAGIGIPKGVLSKSLIRSKNLLDSEYGHCVNIPHIRPMTKSLGRISSYPPGVRNNGGIFCHANPGSSIAETMLGRGAALRGIQDIGPAYLRI